MLCVQCGAKATMQITVTHHEDNGPSKAGTVVITEWCDFDYHDALPGVNLQKVMKPGAFTATSKEI